MKNRNILLLFTALSVWQACSVQDKGNYDYIPQNGVTITFEEEEMNQTVEKGVDTLKINPTIVGDIYGENEEHYTYTWFFCSGEEHRHTVVGKEKNLVWPASLKPGKYTLYLQVDDEGTGLQWIESTGVTIFSELTQGWMLLGETGDGEVRVDMLAQKASDTIVLIENIFDNSEMHLKGARDLIFTGYRSINPELVHLYLSTDDKDLQLTWGNNFIPAGEFHEMIQVEEMEVSKETPRIRDMFPRQAGTLANSMRSNKSRGIVTENAIYMTTISSSSELYVNPMNRYGIYDTKYFKPYPMAFVMGGVSAHGNLNPVFYDMDGRCFVKPYSTYGPQATHCSKLGDYLNDPFRWNDTTKIIVYGENLRNSSAMCNCAALMKDTKGKDINYYVYVFRPGDKSAFGAMIVDPTKVGGYTIDKDVAVDFDKASHYTFMSNANVLLYAVGSTLHAYNYTYNTLDTKDVGSEICYLAADPLLNTNYFWVSTYDGQGGEIQLMTLGGQNTPVITPDEDGNKWQVTMKVVDVEWKYGEDPAEEEPEEEEGEGEEA